MKKVSVVIPCFNDGQYIQEAVQSVKEQTYTNIEIVIIDDGSTDALTLSELAKLRQDGLMVMHMENRGPAAARNQGIQSATGDYILPLDADDKIASSYIEKAIKIIESDQSIGAVYCYAELFGEQTGKWLLPDYSFEEMIVDNVVFVTALFSKASWIKVGGYCESFEHGVEDYDFWLSILELDKKIIQIPEVLFFYRIKNISRTTLFGNNIDKLKNTYDLIYDRHKKLYENNMDLYCKSLRRALIERILYARQLEEALSFKDKINRFPLVKRILKYTYTKLFQRG